MPGTQDAVSGFGHGGMVFRGVIHNFAYGDREDAPLDGLTHLRCVDSTPTIEPACNNNTPAKGPRQISLCAKPCRGFFACLEPVERIR